MNTKHTLGIIGFGGMGRAHFNCLKNFDRVQVKGVFDLDPAAQQVARDRGLIAYESKEALLADPKIDMVLVSTTNEAHKPLLIEAMRAGKNVISEKPVTISSEELLDVIAVSEETGKVSIAIAGELIRDIDADSLKSKLTFLQKKTIDVDRYRLWKKGGRKNGKSKAGKA